MTHGVWIRALTDKQKHDAGLTVSKTTTFVKGGVDGETQDARCQSKWKSTRRYPKDSLDSRLNREISSARDLSTSNQSITKSPGAVVKTLS